MAAVLVATEGAKDPDEVLVMRVDWALWLIEGRAGLNRRAERQARTIQPAGETIDAQGRRRVPIRSIEDLKTFLRSNP